jgi:hypothetical protein
MKWFSSALLGVLTAKNNLGFGFGGLAVAEICATFGHLRRYGLMA